MEWVTVKTFDNTIDAHLLKSKLESEGIKCVLFDENLVSLNPLFNVTVGGIKLKINETDIDKAKVVLTELNEIPFVNEEGKVIKCPQCGSEELYSNFKSMKGVRGVLSAIVSFFLMLFPIYYKSVYRCKDCGKEF